MSDRASINKKMLSNRNRSGKLENENTQLEYDIRELKMARDRLKDCKDEYIRLQKRTAQIESGDHKWKGMRYNEWHGCAGVAKAQDNRNVSSIDEALDTVERDIGRLEAKRLENIAIIKELAQAYYALKAEFNALRN